MAEPTPSFIKRYSWLFAVSGVLLLAFVGYVVKQESAYKALLVMHNATVQEIAQNKPVEGMYSITGARLNYVYAQAVGFTNDKFKDAGSHYDSYVPVIDDKSKQVVMLAKMEGYSPSDMWSHIDDPVASSLVGSFTDPSSVPAEIYTDFVNRKYSVPEGLPVLVVPGGIAPEVVRNRIIIAGLVTLLIGGGPWLVMYLVSRPKKRTKSFSERYPQRRVY